VAAKIVFLGMIAGKEKREREGCSFCHDLMQAVELGRLSPCERKGRRGGIAQTKEIGKEKSPNPFSLKNGPCLGMSNVGFNCRP